MTMTRSLLKAIEGPDPPSESEFSSSLIRVAVSQTCQSMGFRGAQNSALWLLTDVATRYLRATAKLAAASANLHRRTQANLADIMVALEDLASVQGFRGSSSVRSVSFCSSAVIKDLIKFVKYTDEIPFAQPLPPRRIFCFQSRKRKFEECKNNCGGGGGRGDEGRWRHVPRWLPPVVAAELVAEGKENKVKIEKEAKWEENEDKNRDPNMVERLSRSNEAKMKISSVKKGGKVRFTMGKAMKKPTANNGLGI